MRRGEERRGVERKDEPIIGSEEPAGFTFKLNSSYPAQQPVIVGSGNSAARLQGQRFCQRKIGLTSARDGPDVLYSVINASQLSSIVVPNSSA